MLKMLKYLPFSLLRSHQPASRPGCTLISRRMLTRSFCLENTSQKYKHQELQIVHVFISNGKCTLKPVLAKFPTRIELDKLRYSNYRERTAF